MIDTAFINKFLMKKSHLSMMEIQLGPPFNPQYRSAVGLEEFQGCPQLGTHDAERRKSLVVPVWITRFY